MRTARGLALSLALHGALFGALLWIRPVRTARDAPSLALAVEVTEQEMPSTRSSVDRVLRQQEREHEGGRDRKRDSSRAHGNDNKQGYENESATRSPAKPIDLFPHAALAPLAPGRAPNWGGTTLRASDGARVFESNRASDREEAAGRVRDFIGQITGSDRVRSGAVDPKWRDVERQVTEQFHPARELVSTRDVASTYLKQFLAVRDLKGGPVPPGVDPSVRSPVGVPEGMNLRSLPLEQALAAQAATGDATDDAWVRVEIEAEVNARGELLSIRVAVPSGRRRFDRAALDVVRKAVIDRGPTPEGGGAISRWRVEAAVVVSPPTAFGFKFDETGALPGHGLSRFVQPTHGLEPSVQTKVALLFVRPR